MAIKDSLLPEFDHEMGTTRRVLERVPEAHLGWTPHEKSYTLAQLAGHVANIPHWVNATCDVDVFDFADAGGEFRPAPPASSTQLLKDFDANVKTARVKLDALTDASMMGTWTLKNAGQEIFTMPRVAVLRSFILNHLIHHRGQLSVYLRLRDVPVPSIYGPSADEG
jgi:uncharacterized damage-inducible protein DinB